MTGLVQWLAKASGEDPSQFDTVRIGLAHGWATALVVALGVAALVAVFLSFRSSHDLPRRRRVTLLFVRLGAIAAVFALILQPELRLLKTAKVPTRAVIMVDLSASMSVKDTEQGVTRWAWARDYADRLAAALKKRAGDIAVEVTAFDSAPRPMPNSSESAAASDTPPLPKIPWGNRTDIGASIAALPSRHPGETLSTVVVVSDGADHGGLKRELAAGVPPTALQGLGGATVYTAQAGVPELFRDVGVGDLRVDDFGFVHNPVKVEADIDVVGYDGKRVPVTISSDQGVITTKTITAKGPDYHEKVEFEITPRRTGTFTYTVSTARYSDEAVDSNNARPFAIKVIRDKIRVLHIAGMPSWDEKFLRQLLKNDPNVDLVSFFILRTPNDANQYPTEAYSLIPFPTDELFNERLNTFDLVIFQDFTYKNYFTYNANLYLSALRDFTRKGGAFVMIGGANSFGAGSYEGTPIEDILPVTVAGGGGEPESTLDDANWTMQLTDAGKVHPVTQLDFDAADNAKDWASLPPMTGYHKDLVARDDATVLGVVPGKRGPSGAPLPAIAVRKVGDGRSMIINSDTSWKWNFGNIARGGTAAPYLKFWQNAIRWLIKDPDLKQVRVLMDKDNFHAGEDVRGKVVAVGTGYAPLKGVPVKLTISAESPQADDYAPPQVPAGATGDDGEYRFQVPANARGVFRVKAEVQLPDGSVEKDDTVFAFDTEDPELEHAQVDPTLLEALAKAGGGEVLPSDPVAAAAKIQLPPAPPTRIVGERRLGLWDRPLVLLLALALAGGEWFLRRRWGLL